MTQSQPLTQEFLEVITKNTSVSASLSQGQDEDEESTPAQNYAVLTRCWRYERGSNLLLPYPAQFLNPVSLYIERIDGMILDREFTDELQCSMMELEVERLRYIYNDLHRVRLRKIEQQPLYYAFEKQGKSRLSEPELEYAKGYSKLVRDMMQQGFEGLPGKLASESLHFETPATDNVALLHYLPKEQQERILEVPNQRYQLYSNTVIVVPYEECAQWIQQGEFDVL